MWRVALCLLTAVPALAGFSKTTQSVKLGYGQNEVKLVFTADTDIRRAKPHCDCTEVDIEGNRLVATVDTSKFEGQVEKTIDATTADGKTTRLTMRFTVPAAVQLSTRTLQWRVGAPATPQTLRITLPSGSPVRGVTEAALSGSDFDYDPRKGKRPGEFTVTVTPKSTARRVLNRLIIETDSADPRFSRYIIYLQVKK
ncbi:MAG: hypothetical protein Q4F40_05755 [Akkermansia sp.]|nr:hypothetical protein [Akkermansia sp.]